LICLAIILPLHTDDQGKFCFTPITHDTFIIAIIDLLSRLDDEAWNPYDRPEDGMPGDQEDNASDKSDLEAESEVDDHDDSDGANADSGAGQVQVQVPADEPSDQNKFTSNPSVSTFPPLMLPRPTPCCSSGGPGFLSLDSARASTRRDRKDDEWMPAAKRRRSSSRGAPSSSACGASRSGASGSLTTSRRGGSTSSVPRRSARTTIAYRILGLPGYLAITKCHRK